MQAKLDKLATADLGSTTASSSKTVKELEKTVAAQGKEMKKLEETRESSSHLSLSFCMTD